MERVSTFFRSHVELLLLAHTDRIELAQRLMSQHDNYQLHVFLFDASEEFLKFGTTNIASFFIHTRITNKKVEGKAMCNILSQANCWLRYSVKQLIVTGWKTLKAI